MPFLTLLPQTVTIVSYSDSTEDAHGNAARAAGASTDVQGRLEQLSSTEDSTGQSTVDDRWRLFLPAGTVIAAGDEVVENGRTFRVDGTPEQVYGATTVHHIEVRLIYTGDVA